MYVQPRNRAKLKEGGKWNGVYNVIEVYDMAKVGRGHNAGCLTEHHQRKLDTLAGKNEKEGTRKKKVTRGEDGTRGSLGTSEGKKCHDGARGKQKKGGELGGIRK